MAMDRSRWIAFAILVVGAAWVLLIASRPGPRIPPPPAKITKKQPADKLVDNLREQVALVKLYDPRWRPRNELKPDRGVCADVVLRAYQAAGMDIAKAVNDDIRRTEKRYPFAQWDRNIDPRRCRNLIIWFKRHSNAAGGQWNTGDVVFWDTKGDGYATHVGVVTNRRDANGMPYVVHHSPKHRVRETPWLYQWPLLGHFRLLPKTA